MAKGKFEKWLTPDGLLRLTAWARTGLVDEQIAKNIGITPSTLYDWKNKFPQISEALKEGKEVVDIQVENALLKRALGYDCLEEKVEIETTPGGKLKSRKVVQVTKQVQPDVTAQIFWLKNRRPEAWRDKPDVSNDEIFAALDRILGGIDRAAAE